MLPKPDFDPNGLLASILADFGTKPKKKDERKAKAPAKPTQAPVHSIAKQIALMRTGYTTWEPIARALFIRTQKCRCCGEESQFVENEFYLFKHGKAQSRWYRTEGYTPGIEARDLPLEVTRIEEVQPVSACPKCLDDRTLDNLVLTLTSPQLCLEFPDD